MKYPQKYALSSEPEEVRVGDLVWWNEGVCVGFVEDILEQKEDYESWGLDEPSIVLTNLHPFEANKRKHKQRIGLPTSGGSTVNSLGQLEDEGVGLLSEHERSELNWAITRARSIIAPAYRDLPFCVSAVKNMDSDEEEWHFHFVDWECHITETVVFPFRPKTRTERESTS